MTDKQNDYSVCITSYVYYILLVYSIEGYV